MFLSFINPENYNHLTFKINKRKETKRVNSPHYTIHNF